MTTTTKSTKKRLTQAELHRVVESKDYQQLFQWYFWNFDRLSKKQGDFVSGRLEAKQREVDRRAEEKRRKRDDLRNFAIAILVLAVIVLVAALQSD